MASLLFEAIGIIISASGAAVSFISAFLLILDKLYILAVCASILGALLTYCYVKLSEEHDV
ncbi:hypothetical protein KVP40.0044 [Vibrio phage KVP40]|uniref:Uncharacterized protein n=1 Tax=Vibrio phage KVP40 (isolate Vibrio parahaemolyticus/Japan/Matsuzaki/1991) TaxID=75320 RepID=Q6WIA7_BPKVM|nr:hypothetical protein KVP40.0044 [Vibrio phage KVP40]AAQ64115.1 hypothetical protein KVP40.0044 [Vibrio phage KVP40]